MRPRTALVLFLLSICGCILLSGCGNTFRPIAQAIPQAGGDPGLTKNAVILSAYGSSPGTATHIDVSGDTTVAVHTLGANPVHAGFVSGEARVMIDLAGDEVVGYGRYIFIPDTWYRAERDRAGRLSVLRIIVALAFAIVAIAALIAATMAWTRAHFDRRAFWLAGTLLLCAAILR